MAKLEELVTPTELLDAIRDGALKRELVKKYRTSDQQLAMILLPFYRNGKLTKEEFNDFFKGVPLRSQAENVEGGSSSGEDSPRSADEPPSQILRALSEVVESPSVKDAEPASVVSENETPLNKALPSETKELQQSADAHMASPTPLRPESVRQEAGADEIGIGAADSAGMTGLLEMIFAKLNSIEDRLSGIEKKIS
jgi:hypothetical protein